MTHSLSLEQNESAAVRLRKIWVLGRYWLVREWKTRYAGSMLGWVWALVQPMASLAIFYVLFGLVLAVRVPGVASSNGYLLHLLAGLAVWLPFTDAVGRGVGCLVAYEDFLRKQPIPAEILPFASVGGSLLVLLIGYVMLMVMAPMQGVLPGIHWLWVPVLILAQLIITLGVTLLLSMAHFLWRDVSSLVGFMLQLWFYLTPIVYPLSQVPERYHFWYFFNPLACLVLCIQWAVLGLAVPSGVAVALAAWVLLLGVGGWWFFSAMKPALGEAL
jgi:lipopolysaccharide transport system permease protein